MDSWTPNVNFTKAGPSVYLGVIQLVPTQNFRVRVRVRGQEMLVFRKILRTY